MTGAVRMALEAAGEATWQAIDLIGDIPPDTPQAQQIAAAAIAAFLRALPDTQRIWGQSVEDFRALNERLAAAVEAAAKEGV